MRKPFLIAAAVALSAALALTIFAAEGTPYSPALWSGLRYRMIGPLRGGRVTAVTGVPSQPYTFYMGSTGGGVWKTTDAGHSWQNISDAYFKVASIGAVDVSLSDPNVVYVGTGSSKIRSNVSIGRGMYKSTDGGKTWTFAGLRDTGQIATVRTHPTNPDIVYAATLGDPFAPNPDRGVFRRKMGARPGRRCSISPTTSARPISKSSPATPTCYSPACGAANASPGPSLAAPSEGGIYKSTDGGDTWNKLAGGLPDDLFGRANVAISAAKPDRIYALIEAKPGAGLYRSEDAGATWTLINGSGALITRPFYYDTLGVDPNDPDVVFVGDESWFRAPTAARASGRARAPWRQSRHLDQSEKLAVHDPSATTAAPMCRSMAAAPGARRTINPPPRSIRSPSTINTPTASMARSRTTPRSSCPAFRSAIGQGSASVRVARPAPSFPTLSIPISSMAAAKASSAART